jgi:2-polyprenyl-3-methyl-5-hydroxy-6-metoxy-1,4-benzoquinol methylase
MNRPLTDKDLAYDRLSPSWEAVISDFDTRRRVAVLVRRLLSADKVSGKSCLDVGCGLGYFTAALLEFRPARMTAVDIAPSLVERLSRRLPSVVCRAADVLQLSEVLGDEQFDTVVCSEVIEHTPDPARAFAQLAARVAPGGYLALSCPNRRWKWLLHLANLFGLRRHYEGYENWVSPADLKRWVRDCGLELVRTVGIHTVPWHASPRLTEFLDRRLENVNYSLSVNLAVLARRPLAQT